LNLTRGAACRLAKILNSIAADGEHQVGRVEAAKLKASHVKGAAASIAHKTNPVAILEAQKEKKLDAEDKVALDKADKSADKVAIQEVEKENKLDVKDKLAEAEKTPPPPVELDPIISSKKHSEKYNAAAETQLELVADMPSFTGKTKAEIREIFFRMSERADSVEDEFILEDFDSTFDDFNEAAIQYGYLAIFAPAYPLAALFAVRARPGHLSILSVSHSKSGLYGWCFCMGAQGA
jgi:hypothetical protein